MNAAGEHVYWLSCEYCGHSYRYLQQHLTSRDVYASGTGMTLAQYQAEANASLQWEETQALNTTELYPGTFTLSKKSAAKTSSWAESDVNLALNDDLLDTALLGSDYTKPISRLQFCSVAVRLAETLTGKSITPPPRTPSPTRTTPTSSRPMPRASPPAPRRPPSPPTPP